MRLTRKPKINFPTVNSENRPPATAPNTKAHGREGCKRLYDPVGQERHAKLISA